MSFIFQALQSAETMRRLKGPSTPKTTAGASPVSNRRRLLLCLGLLATAAGAVVYGHWHRSTRAVPVAKAALSSPSPSPSSLPSLATAPPMAAFSTLPSLSAAAAPASGVISARIALQASMPPGRKTGARQPAARASESFAGTVEAPRAAAYSQPRTLAEPLPPPGLFALRNRGLSAPPLEAIAAGPVIADDARRSATDPPQPFDRLPPDVQLLVRHMNVRLHLYAPQPRNRLLLVDGRQLREGDELSAGLRLDEITETGMVLRYDRIRVLAPMSTTR